MLYQILVFFYLSKIKRHILFLLLCVGFLCKIKRSLAYLWQSSVKLSLQRVSFMANFVQFALGQAQILLSLSQSVQKTITLLQHGHHQRLKVTL